MGRVNSIANLCYGTECSEEDKKVCVPWSGMEAHQARLIYVTYTSCSDAYILVRKPLLYLVRLKPWESQVYIPITTLAGVRD